MTVRSPARDFASPAPTGMHRTVRTSQLSVTASASALVRIGHGVTSANIDTPELHAIDLVDGPDLVSVDLSACAPGLHLRVADCPALRRLGLPRDGSGAYLHLDFGRTLPHLTATGAIADVDFCRLETDELDPYWVDADAEQGVGPLRGRDRRGPLSGMFIGGPEDTVPGQTELVVLQAGTARSELTLPASAREVLLHDLAGLRTLRLPDGASLDWLEAERCPDLLELTGAGRVDRVRIDGAAPLTRLDWSGRHASVARSGSASLLVDAPWQTVSVRESGLRALDARFVDQIEVYSCTDLRRIQASPDAVLVAADVGRLEQVDGVAEIDFVRVTPREILEGAFLGDPRLVDQVVTWLARRHGPSATNDALQVLHACAVAGWSAEPLWDARCTLHARSCLALQVSDDANTWAWNLPDDLGHLGWEADLRLWRRALGAHRAADAPWSAPDPREFGHVVAEASEPEHLLAIATATARAYLADADDADSLFGLLLGSLDSGARRGSRLGCEPFKPPGLARTTDPNVGIRAAAFDRIRGTLALLLRLREYTDAPAAAALLARWVGRRMPYAQGLDLLGALRDLGCGEATASLAGFAGDATEPRRKQHALALLMRAPTSTHLAVERSHR